MAKEYRFFIIMLVFALVLFAAGFVGSRGVSAQEADMGEVHVVIENFTYVTAEEGSSGELPPWSGVLVDRMVPLKSDSTMMSCIVDAADMGDKNGTPVEIIGAENNYISQIEGLGEFDGIGCQSGWMGTLNDWFTNRGFMDFGVENGWLEDGDFIHIMFTNSDRGGSDLGGKIEADDPNDLCSLSSDKGVLSPEFSVSETEYTLTLDSSVDSILLNAVAANKGFIVRYYKGETYSPTDKGLNKNKRITVKNGDTLLVVCGDPSWPSMNSAPDEAMVCSIHIVQESAGDDDKEKEDRAAAKEVDDSIMAIGNVTLDSKAVIEAARNAYDALSSDRKAYVSNLSVLENAERTYAALKAADEKEKKDKAAAADVDSKIAAIGTVTPESKTAIESARAAYEALTAEQKAYVTKKDILEKAEQDFKHLKKEVELKDISFADVLPGSWYYDSVRYVYSAGIMTGTSEKTFEPQTKLTRSMFVAMLYRMNGSPAVVTDAVSVFDDVKKGWYSEAVAWAYENKVVSGTGNGLFSPDMEISREQMAVMMYRCAEYLGGDTSARGNLRAFLDGREISFWAKDAMSWANGLGLITGVDKNTLAPKNTASRAEAAAVFTRFMKQTEI